MILLGVIVAAFWPVWFWYVRRMTDGSDEPMGVMALIVGLFIFRWKREAIVLTKTGSLAAVACLVLYLMGFQMFPPLLKAVLAVTAIACLSGTISRRPGLCCLLLLSLPVVASLQFYFGYPMRLCSAIMADGILSMVGCDLERQGTELILNGNVPVGVDPPCSGIRMLWMGAFLSALICAVDGYRWLRTCIVMVGGCFAVVLANGFRVTLLFVKESGLLPLPEWTHDGIGIVVFFLVVLGLRKGADLSSRAHFPQEEVGPEREDVPLNGRVVGALLLICLFSSTMPLASGRFETSQTTNEAFPGWPEKWQGHFLEPLRLSAAEEKFASDFPGEIGVFRAGNAKVIVRWVTRPTRLLHSSADCLRAEGYEIETERAGRFIAWDATSAHRYFVEERIFNDDQSWREVSSWFWSAAFQRTEGPWWAVTTITSIP